jgi:hypothetical protein
MSNEKNIELVAELTAYRAACIFLLKTVKIFVDAKDEPQRTLLIEEIENQFTLSRSEWLHPAPTELSPEEQTFANRTMQDVLRNISENMSQKLRDLPDSKNDKK